ncbi:MAG: dihydroorotase [Pseudomonadota bacterium]|nr:dihydroorotase [Pseudomonadota bacterium]HJO36813.1 dihydroorotase [Gammaproteobacteria bacterium]
MTDLVLTQPDDWHLHLRDGAAMVDVLAHSAREFGRAVVMPNLRPPVTTLAAALAYRERILAARPAGSPFEPLMTLYLTERTAPAEIAAAAADPRIIGVKLYPAGATTHSDAGVTDIRRVEPVLAAMAESGLPLLVHGEVTDPAVDVFDRERVFLDRVLAPLCRRLPALKVVLEHVTTAEGVAFVREGGANVGATITPQHLLYSRNALFEGGLRPHRYCLPVLKRERDRQALIEAATAGESRFFLGTDSAPHARGAKLADCGCAGCFTAHAALALYAEVFESVGRLAALEAFASHNGPRFYGLPVNTGRVRLVRAPWTTPATLPLGGDVLVPLRAGETLAWQAQPEPTP